MSIARTAPESFELQDLVCVELILRFGFQRIEKFLVEPKGGEDGALLTRSPDPLIYEIQGKASASMATLADLARWLTHFPERRDTQMLLERLIDDPSRRLIVVVAGRAADALDPLTAPTEWAGELLKVPPMMLAKSLLQAFQVSAIDDTSNGDLHISRVAHHAKVAKSMTLAQIRHGLGRTIVIERANRANVMDRIGRYLRARGLPDDVHPEVIGRLRAIVGLKRMGVEDLASPIADQIAREVPHSIRPLNYISGAEEAGWVETVRAANCLLLSGVTRSGKSVAARWVAAEFESQGARVDVFTGVEEAERFLMNPGAGLRIAVLDDPLGGAHHSPEPERQLQRLEVLIGKLNAARRLIVAQGRERLLDVAGFESLADCAIRGHEWLDTTARPLDFLADLWLAFAAQAEVGEPLRTELAGALQNGAIRLEPGTLEFLANLPAANSGDMTVEDAERAALIDAKTLSRALASEACSPSLIQALAIGSSPNEAIRWDELAFIAGAGGDVLPSKASYLGLMTTIGGEPRTPAPLPSYSEEPKLDAQSVNDLEMLERRHMVEFSETNYSNFTHPLYRAAAELMFQAPSRAAIIQMLKMHERALFARSVSTSRAAARNLDWLLERAGRGAGVPKALFDHAEAGLQSLYPATRDLCFDFLRRKLGHPDAGHVNIVAAGERVASVELETLDWLRGEAMFPVDGHIRNDALIRSWDLPSAKAIAPALAVLAADGGSALTPEAAADTLLYLKGNPDDAAIEHIASLLSYDEAVLRAEAAEIWLSRERTDDDAILNRIFSDPHPLVARRALGGVIEGYIHCSLPRQTELVEGLLRMATAPANSMLFMQRLVLFDRDHLMPAERPWPIFEALMPVVFEFLPVNAEFVEARLHNVLLHAGAELSKEAVARVCERWVEWVERMNAAACWLGDYSLGVMDILVHFLADRPELRGEMIPRLLSLTITTSRLTVINDSFAWWPSLSATEREALRNCLTEDASDTLWRKAVALTRIDVPPEIEGELLPEGVHLSDGYERLRAMMSENLFHACIAVLTGKPDSLGRWSPTPVPEVWNSAIQNIASNPHDPLFLSAFAMVIAQAGRKDPAFINTLTTAAQIDPNTVFELLLERTIFDGANARADQWSVLLSLPAAAAYRDRWIARMAKVAHEVVPSVTALQSWVKDAEMHKGLLAELAADYKVYEGLTSLIQLKEVIDSLIAPGQNEQCEEAGRGKPDVDLLTTLPLLSEVIVTQIEASSIQFLQTVDDTCNLLKRMDLLTEDIKSRLNEKRDSLIPTISAERKKYLAARREVLLEGWISET